MRRFTASMAVICAIAAALAAPAGCSRSDSTPGNSSGGQRNPWSAYEEVTNYATQRGQVVYQVTYKPDTVVFDGAVPDEH